MIFSKGEIKIKTDGGNNNYVIMLNPNGVDNYINYTIDNENNRILNSGGGFVNRCIAGTFTRTNGVISNFQPKLPFRAVDYNDLDTKVNKSGDTMTGTLELTSGATMSNVNNNFDYTATTAPSKAQYAGVINFKDKNNNTVGNIETEHWTDNRIYTLMGVKRKINGSVVSANARLAIDENGNKYFDFPMCTTKPTTTSTASSSKIAVVTKNYLNGTSWYRVWSDGFIEQGGYQSSATGSVGLTVTFLKPFSNTNYTVIATVTGAERYFVSCLNKTAESFFWRSFSEGGQGYDKQGNWYACGY